MLHEHNNAIAEKKAEAETAQAVAEDAFAVYKKHLRTMEENGKLSYWSVLFEANSFSDLLDRLQMVEEIARADQRRLKEMREASQAVEEAQAALNAEKAELEVTRAELSGIEEELKVKRQEADAILLELNARDDALEDLLELQHDADEKLAWQGPSAWVTGGSSWTYEYRLRRTGVLTTPIILKKD